MLTAPRLPNAFFFFFFFSFAVLKAGVAITQSFDQHRLTTTGDQRIPCVPHSRVTRQGAPGAKYRTCQYTRGKKNSFQFRCRHTSIMLPSSSPFSPPPHNPSRTRRLQDLVNLVHFCVFVVIWLFVLGNTAKQGGKSSA